MLHTPLAVTLKKIQTMNNYMKLLLYLKRFEGDGKFHPIEHLFHELSIDEMKVIFNELVEEKLIDLTGHEPRYTSFILEQNLITGESKVTSNPLNDIIMNSEPNEYKAKITFKGSKYLKEELEMQNSGKYNINVSGQGANNTFVIESENVTVSNKQNFEAKTEEIIKAIKDDSTISDSIKGEAISAFESAKIELSQFGKISATLLPKLLQYGSQISSIGSLVLKLLSS